MSMVLDKLLCCRASSRLKPVPWKTGFDGGDGEVMLTNVRKKFWGYL